MTDTEKTILANSVVYQCDVRCIRWIVSADQEESRRIQMTEPVHSQRFKIPWDTRIERHFNDPVVLYDIQYHLGDLREYAMNIKDLKIGKLLTLKVIEESDAKVLLNLTVPPLGHCRSAKTSWEAPWFWEGINHRSTSCIGCGSATSWDGQWWMITGNCWFENSIWRETNCRIASETEVGASRCNWDGAGWDMFISECQNTMEDWTATNN